MDRSRTTNLPKLAEQYRGLSDLILDSELFRLDAMLHQPVASEPKLQQDGVQQEMESSTDSFHAPDDDDIFDDFIDFGQEYWENVMMPHVSFGWLDKIAEFRVTEYVVQAIMSSLDDKILSHP